MFTRLWQAVRSLFAKTQPPPDDLDNLDVFTPKERLIYAFFDGSAVRRVDPLPLYKRLKDVWPELSADIIGARSPSKFADKAHAGLVEKCYRVFEVVPYRQKPDGTEEGLGEVEVLDLLDHFLTYTGGIKKNLSHPPTSAAATPASTGSSSADASPTPNTSDCGSTGDVPSTGPPSPSPTGPPSPSEPPPPTWPTLTPLPTEKAKPS